MPDLVALDRSKHKDLRVITRRGEDLGDRVHLVPVVASELSSLVLDYPVCFLKEDNTGQFGLYAILGFEAGENLFLSGEQWEASYIPLHLRRQPFLVAQPPGNGAAQGDAQAEGILTIDMASQRIGSSQGEPLFTPEGEKSPFLEAVEKALGELLIGARATEALIRALLKNDLVESAQVNVEFASGEKRNFDGLYTVNASKLKSLSGDMLGEFHRRGYLLACHLLIASLGQMRGLIRRKERRAS
ncbi:MAG: SapC family protein [Pseudomonadota bacterium]